jgi:hypothetical protein
MHSQTQKQPLEVEAMTTDVYTEKLSLWLDDELSDHEVSELRRHLDSCAHCRQEYAALRHIDTLLKSAATIMAAPAPEFAKRVEARLADYGPRQVWHLWLALGALLGGPLLFLGAGAVAGSVTLLSLSNTCYDAGLYNEVWLSLSCAANSVRLMLNLGLLMIKTSLLVMQQPLFWASVGLTGMFAWSWAYGFRVLVRRGTTA